MIGLPAKVARERSCDRVADIAVARSLRAVGSPPAGEKPQSPPGSEAGQTRHLTPKSRIAEPNCRGWRGSTAKGRLLLASEPELSRRRELACAAPLPLHCSPPSHSGIPSSPRRAPATRSKAAFALLAKVTSASSHAPTGSCRGAVAETPATGPLGSSRTRRTRSKSPRLVLADLSAECLSKVLALTTSPFSGTPIDPSGGSNARKPVRCAPALPQRA